MKSKLEKNIYRYDWEKDNVRWAEIIFRISHSSGEWVFSGCQYFGVGKVYTLDDWDFLLELAIEIKELCKENGVNEQKI